MFKNIKKSSIFFILILFAYIFFILYITLLSRRPFEGLHLKLDLFWSYKVLKEQWKQIIENILLFIPLGVFLSLVFKRKWFVFIIGFLFSCLIEFLQFKLKLGLCELDDILHNSLGLVFGIIFVYIFNKIQFKNPNNIK